MFKQMKIFNIVFGVLICLAPVAVHAADDEECVFFNPALALCSTHSHNIGFIDGTTHLPANPVKSEEVARMNEVIALKSTVIAQQLKEQYDALNAIIKRFKTQLEKAVLTSKIEVLTGNSASGNSGGGSSSGAYSSGGGALIAGASDCMTYSGSSNIGSCLMTNSAIIVNVANSDTSAAKKQLANDLYVADMYGLCNVNTDAPQCCSQVNVAKEASDKAKAITQKVNGFNKNQIISCAQTMRARISTSLEDKQRQNNRNNQSGWGNNYPG